MKEAQDLMVRLGVGLRSVPDMLMIADASNDVTGRRPTQRSW